MPQSWRDRWRWTRPTAGPAVHGDVAWGREGWYGVSDDGSVPDRCEVIGLVWHQQEASELACSQARVRLAVTAWLRGLALLETFEINAQDGRREVDAMLRRLTEVVLDKRVRLVLTCGLSRGGRGGAGGSLQERWIEDALVWLGLQGVPVERLPEIGSGTAALPIPRQLLLGKV